MGSVVELNSPTGVATHSGCPHFRGSGLRLPRAVTAVATTTGMLLEPAFEYRSPRPTKLCDGHLNISLARLFEEVIVPQTG